MGDILLPLVKIADSAVLWVLLCFYLKFLFGPMTTSKPKAILIRCLLGCLWCLATYTFTVVYYRSILHLIIALWLSRYYAGKSAAKSLVICIFIAVKMFVLLLSLDGLLIKHCMQYRWWLIAEGYIIQCLVMLIIAIPLHHPLVSLTQILNILPTQYLFVFWIIFFATGIILYLISLLASNTVDAMYSFTLNFWLMMILLLLNICFIFILSQTMKSHFEKLQAFQIQQKITSQIQHYQAVEMQNKESRQFAHDLQNRLCALSGYIHYGQYNNALAAIDDMHQHPICNVVPITGSAPMDSVFAEKKQLADENRIMLTCAVVLLDSINEFDEMDLAVIIANGLDNALEASMQIDDPDKRKILCAISTYDDSVLIKIQNRTIQNISIPPSLQLVTSKADADNHGLGLSSIHRLATKYNGTLALSCENCIFTLEVLLPLNFTQK